MDQKTENIQKRYDGFLQTPRLWKEDVVFGLNQFEIDPKFIKIDFEIDEKLRLGKYIERFVSFQLQQEKSIQIIAENIQVQKEKRTLGELDCILLKNNKPLHLEIIYKFYLYDESVGNTEIEHFIGPNRKDALLEKLNKLKEKQLPLLYSKECEKYLTYYNININEIEQQVYFKAQLFVPFSKQNIQLTILNKSCISGFYIHQKELNQFADCKFFIPIKKDWLLVPHQNVNWMNFEQFKETSTTYLLRKFAPLCWMKSKNGTINKFFLVWY